MNQIDSELVKNCEEMGKAAQALGLQRAEKALDPAFSEVLNSLEYGVYTFHETTKPYCDAWERGWAEAQMTSPQVEVIDTNKFQAVLVQEYSVCETSRGKYSATADERLTMIRPNPNGQGLFTLWVRKNLVRAFK